MEVLQQDDRAAVSQGVGRGAPMESVTRFENISASADVDVEAVSSDTNLLLFNMQRK